MSERLYYINNQWVTYEQAHNEYGYTNSRPESVDLFNSNCELVIVRKDTDDNTFWDESSHAWVQDIDTLGLYKRLGTVTFYRGSSLVNYLCYSHSYNDSSATHVSISNHITPASDLYYTLGITEYRCVNYYMKGAALLCWYDEQKNLYWDNIKKEWVTDAPIFDDSGKHFSCYITEIQEFDDCDAYCASVDAKLPNDLTSYVTVLQNYYFNEPLLCYADYTVNKSYTVENPNGYTVGDIHYDTGDMISNVTFKVVFPNNIRTVTVKSNELFGDDTYHSEEDFNLIVEQAQLVESA